MPKKKKAKKGYHIMPDGMMMKDSEMRPRVTKKMKKKMMNY